MHTLNCALAGFFLCSIFADWYIEDYGWFGLKGSIAAFAVNVVCLAF